MPISRTATLLFAACIAAGWTAPACAEPTRAELPAAVVFAYNRFGEDRTPSSSIRLDQFEAHLEELQTGGYAVLPLPDIVEALRAGRPLPDRAVALTIDEASRSAYEEAWPRLREAGLPFTLFVATDPLDRGSVAHMSWDQVREMAAAGVTIGGLGTTTLPLALRSPGEMPAELRRMAARFQSELQRRPMLFAYPQGEYSAALRQAVGEAGVGAAFGLHSGVMYAGADRLTFPRFVMNEAFGGIDRFRLAANALPLPVGDLTPEDPVIVENPPPLGFTVDSSVGSLARLACFASGQGRAAVEIVGDDRVEVRIAAPFPPGRARVNCTLPVADGRWRWYGVQFLIPE